MLFPNQYELELLAEMTIHSVKDVNDAFSKLHRLGIETIILTSSEIKGQPDALYASTRDPTTGLNVLYRATFVKVPAHFTGTGDLIAALLVAWLIRYSNNLPMAIKKALSTMKAVLTRTHQAVLDGRNPNQELLLVGSRKDIVDPDVSGFSVQRIDNPGSSDRKLNLSSS